ncbi:hypothetical protein AAZX31_06G285400 [Glycine max]
MLQFFNIVNMGNCLRNNKISSQDHENYAEAPVIDAKVEKVKALSLSKLEEAPRMDQQGMKKVRFKMQNDDNTYEGERGSKGNSRSVRIRVVMTQEELKRMMRCKDEHTSLEQLLHAVKLRGGKISEVGEFDDDQGLNSSWKPSLDSIPEDH